MVQELQRGHAEGATTWGTHISAIQINAVPEPASWALMLAGAALLSGLARRRGSRSFPVL